jgi:hypothetical protein
MFQTEDLVKKIWKMVIHVGIGKLKSYKHLLYHYYYHDYAHIHDSLDGLDLGIMFWRKWKSKSSFCRSKTNDNLLSTESLDNILFTNGYKLLKLPI